MYNVGILNNTRVHRSGGGFQYMMSLIEGLREQSDFAVTVFYDDPAFTSFCFPVPHYRWVRIAPEESLAAKAARALSTVLEIRSPLLGRYQPLAEEKPDLLVCFDTFIGFHLGIPFVNFTGDVMYKYYPDLPEYTLKKRAIRDLIIARTTKHSVFTVVDSQESKRDLVKFFNLVGEKIRSIPLCAPPHIYRHRDMKAPEIREVLDRCRIPERFIFYPAQSWPHKNHLRLIRALDLLKRRQGVEIPAVFVGSAWENAHPINSLIRELGMEAQIVRPGYLEEREIVALYKKATALVFASFADYTNIPVLEAMVLGTPIVCANAFSMPEQCGEAGIFFDPFDIEDMAEKILRVWRDESLRSELIFKGFQRAAELSADRFADQWKTLIGEARGKGIVEK